MRRQAILALLATVVAVVLCSGGAALALTPDTTEETTQNPTPQQQQQEEETNSTAPSPSSSDVQPSAIHGQFSGAWGDNFYGQLGNGTNTNSSNVPVQVSNLSSADIKEVSAGNYHSLALKADGTVSAWGENVYG